MMWNCKGFFVTFEAPTGCIKLTSWSRCSRFPIYQYLWESFHFATIFSCGQSAAVHPPVGGGGARRLPQVALPRRRGPGLGDERSGSPIAVNQGSHTIPEARLHARTSLRHRGTCRASADEQAIPACQMSHGERCSLVRVTLQKSVQNRSKIGPFSDRFSTRKT
jgi:hypothetical protein